MGMSRPETCRG